MTLEEGALPQATKNGRAKVEKKSFFNGTSCWVRCAIKQNWYKFLDNIPGHSRQQRVSWKKRNTVNMGGPGVSKQNYSRVSKRQT